MIKNSIGESRHGDFPLVKNFIIIKCLHLYELPKVK